MSYSLAASSSEISLRPNAPPPGFKPRSIFSTGNSPSLAQQSKQTSDLAERIANIPRPPPGFGDSFLKNISALASSDQQKPDLAALASSNTAAKQTTNVISKKTALTIIDQVEFYFTDINLATSFLFNIMVKDPEGFVPISAIASMKKIKTMTRCPIQLATVLRGSSKLEVSEDGNKVRRVVPLSESDMEEVQSRIILAENLPEDHSYKRLLMIFSKVGSVKAIRTCQPSDVSNKVHAFVEYDSVELAEKAVMELNEGNWRNGLKIRPLIDKRSPKSAQARIIKHVSQENESRFKEKDGLGKDLNSLGRGRGKPSIHSAFNRGNYQMVVSPNVVTNTEQTATKPYVPRMPDGTRGFTMGRGKPLSVKTA